MVLCVAACSCLIQAQTKSKSTSKKAAPVAAGPRFSDRDRDTITKYFHSPYSNLPSSLKNGGPDVPPNVRKQVVRSGTLPPELRPLPLPPPLEARLPRLPKPFQRAVVGPDVIILNGKTQQISDVMQSVLIPAHGMYN
jgi:hypothetical protein